MAPFLSYVIYLYWLECTSHLVFLRAVSRPAVHGANPTCHAANWCPRPGSPVWPSLVWSRQGCPGLGGERQGCVIHLWVWGGGKVPAQTWPWSYLPRPPGTVNLFKPKFCVWNLFRIRMGLNRHETHSNSEDRLKRLHLKMYGILIGFTELSIVLIFLSFTTMLGCWGWLWVLCQETAGNTILRTQLLRGIWQRWCHDERGWDSHVFISGAVLSFTHLETAFTIWDDSVSWSKSTSAIGITLVSLLIYFFSACRF